MFIPGHLSSIPRLTESPDEQLVPSNSHLRHRLVGRLLDLPGLLLSSLPPRLSCDGKGLDLGKSRWGREKLAVGTVSVSMLRRFCR